MVRRSHAGRFLLLFENPIYVGEIRHKGVCHPGQHAPIVSRALWDKVGQLLRGHSTGSGARSSGTKSCVLMGELFDESGEGLTPSRAVKGDRRYRYYVSRSLMKGPAARVDGGWRLPAAEIERSVAAAAQSILDDQQTVVSAIEEAALGSSRIAPLLKSAAAWSERLQLEQDNALSSLIDRVDLWPGWHAALDQTAALECRKRGTPWFESPFNQTSPTHADQAARG